MLRWSFPLGKILGIDLRIHASFPLLLALAIAWSIYATGSSFRGIGLWLALVFAVSVGETARIIAVAWSGMRLRALFLLPKGSVMALMQRANGPYTGPVVLPPAVTLVAPVANLAVGLVLIALSLATDPQVPVFAQPWISISHILRSFIWLQFTLAVANLLPSANLSTAHHQNRRVDDLKTPAIRAPAVKPSAAPMAQASGKKALPAVGFGTALASGLIVLGLITMAASSVTMGLWPLLFGVFLLLNARLRGSQSLSETDSEAILVSEVMLTEYSMLSSSDTLQGALAHTVHSLQDVFPVVRGDRLVGSISRQTIHERLQAEGDSYLQGIMTRNLQLASPTETVVIALRRAASLGASEFIPVVEGAAMLGILTPQSLSRAVHQVKQSRVTRETRENQERD